jgi:peptide/nickel transport system permease protein
MFGITLMTFVIVRIVPADPARAAAGLEARQDQVEEMRRRMGLDLPLPVQYFRYMSGLIQGNLGTSARTQRPVLEEIAQYLPATIELVVSATLMAIIVGIPMGIMAATRQGSALDRLLQALAIGGGAMPRFWLALLMQIVFFLFLRWFPIGGRYDILSAPPRTITGFYIIDTLIRGDWGAFKVAIQYLFLPALTLSVAQLANLVRITRKSFVNELRQDYVRTAYAKGLHERVVIYLHVLKNAAIPIITITGLQLGWLFSGAVLVEVVFAWPGIGKYMVDAISFVDFEPVMGVTLAIALIFVMINLVVDISYTLVDPRIRY